MQNSEPRCIAWLASFPKSGNTWVRVFLANYLKDSDTPVSINQLSSIALGDSMLKFYQRYEPSFDPKDELRSVQLREGVLRGLIGNPKDLHFLKTHNVNGNIEGIDLIPPALTRAAIYIVRNPLDVVVSYADHYGLTVEEAADAMCSIYNRVIAHGESVTQYLGDWSGHVRSWTKASPFPVHVIRYEDLLRDPYKTFRTILLRLSLKIDKERIEKAVAFSSFDTLKKQEAESGFIERSEKSTAFFRSGKSEAWRDVISEDVYNQIKKNHGKTMKKYKYL